MSDHFIEVVPTIPAFVPSQEAIRASVKVMEEIAPLAKSVSFDLSTRVKFRDCGGNFSAVICPECNSVVPMEWWSSKMTDQYRGEGFLLSQLSLPCRHNVSSLNELKYEMEQGFSMFALTAMNPRVGTLTASQVLALEESLQCKVRVIYRHI